MTIEQAIILYYVLTDKNLKDFSEVMINDLNMDASISY